MVLNVSICIGIGQGFLVSILSIWAGNIGHIGNKIIYVCVLCVWHGLKSQYLYWCRPRISSIHIGNIGHGISQYYRVNIDIADI